jgi:hypothetical protein
MAIISTGRDAGLPDYGIVVWTGLICLIGVYTLEQLLLLWRIGPDGHSSHWLPASMPPAPRQATQAVNRQHGIPEWPRLRHIRTG